MKSSMICLLALMFLAPLSLIAQPSKYLKVGVNYSYVKEPSYGEPGVSYLFGIGKDWRLYRWIQLRIEVLISNSTTALRSKSVHTTELYDDFPYLPSKAIQISYFEIDIELRYLEIPILFNVEKTLRKNLSIGLELGYSLKFPPNDASKATVQRRINSTELPEDERQNFRLDYRVTGWLGENYSYRGRGLCPNFGMFVHYSKFQIDLRYQADYVDWVSSIVIGHDVPFRIWNLSMGFRF